MATDPSGVAGDAGDEIRFQSMGIRIFTSGRVERSFGSEFIPAAVDPANGVASKDAVIAPGVSARVYLPPPPASGDDRLPILVYYHGGGFCLCSAFNPTFHDYCNNLAALARAVVISVEYRLAPEQPVPVAHDDSWVALRWVAAGAGGDPWIADRGDLARLFLGGESAGANIAHHMAIRAADEPLPGGAEIRGLVLVHPYFLGSDKLPSDDLNPEVNTALADLWAVVCPSRPSVDDPLINPFAGSAPPLDRVAAARVLVCVAEKDVLRDRGRKYADGLAASGWRGEVAFHQAVGVGHTFHLIDTKSMEAVKQDKVIAGFINGAGAVGGAPEGQ